jgi:hypothetical protein
MMSGINFKRRYPHYEWGTDFSLSYEEAKVIKEKIEEYVPNVVVIITEMTTHSCGLMVLISREADNAAFVLLMSGDYFKNFRKE